MFRRRSKGSAAEHFAHIYQGIAHKEEKVGVVCDLKDIRGFSRSAESGLTQTWSLYLMVLTENRLLFIILARAAGWGLACSPRIRLT